MNCVLLWLFLLHPAAGPERETTIQQWIAEIARSGRVVDIREDRLADPRKQIAPGAPPLLSFRYFLGADRHRFGKLDVMLDDAGH
jgi:hypothetical protein